jgi:serine/threonine-protein kinase
LEAERSTARLLAPNARIGGKYVLVRRLAAGGMGDVWLARNETTSAHVAAKILRPNPDQRTQAEERFRREARLGGLLAHRSIVRIFDFLEEPDGTLVLVMELLRGDTLERWIEQRGGLPLREAMAIVAAVLSALQHGHEQGVVHRDVKPSNILLAVEPDGRIIPKLLDFGIAKMPKNDTSKTMDGVVLGTPSYMSPEQIKSEPDLDGRSDLFSAAVVLYEALTGTCPFAAPTPSAAIAAVLQSAVDPDARIAPLLWLEVQRALSKRPKQRHASASEMSAAMLAAIGETEDSLSTVLRTEAPRDFLAGVSGPYSARAAVLDAQTRSVDGQSVATAVAKRGSSWVALAGVGALVASAAVVAAVAHGSVPGRPAASPAAAAPATAPAKETAASAPPSASGEPSLPPQAAALPAAPSPADSPAAPPRGASPPPRAPHHGLPKPHAPRPIATSPGF